MKATFTSFSDRKREHPFDRTSRYSSIDENTLDIYDFISDRERRRLEKRLATAVALIHGDTYEHIVESLHVSTASVAAVARMLEIEVGYIANENR